MSRKVALGILAWLPFTLIVGLAFYLATYLVARLPALSTLPTLDLNDPEVVHFLVVLVGGACVVALLQIVFSVVFIIDATGRVKMQGLPAALWALGFVFVGELLFPVYWLVYVVRAPAPAERSSVGG